MFKTWMLPSTEDLNGEFSGAVGWDTGYAGAFLPIGVDDMVDRDRPKMGTHTHTQDVIHQ